MYSFDELDNVTGFVSNNKPIWKIDVNNDKALLQWLNSEIDFLLQDQQERINEIRYHFDLYKGYVWDRQKKNAEYYETEPNRKSRLQKKINVNQLYELTEQIVARTARYKPSVQFIPPSNEWRDRFSVEIAKCWADYIKENEQLDQKVINASRIAKIAGECYLAIEWDNNKGPVHEAAKALGENRLIGDVSFRVVYPDNMFFEKAFQYEEARYVFERKYIHTEELKAEYPHLPNLGSDARSEIYDRRTGTTASIKNYNTVYCFWHKRTKFLPQGLYVKFIKNHILERGPNKYNHGELPFERIYDIDIPGEQHAKSFFVHARNLAGNYSNLTTMIIKNQKLVASPKWMVPLGSVNTADLHNDIGVVVYKGPTPPILAQANPTPGEVFRFRQELKEDLRQISGVFGQSMGQPPAGIKAGIALQFLEEQENSRMNAWISQYNRFIKNIFHKAISVAAQFYDKSDNRTVKLLGKGNEYKVKKIDPDLLATPFDIRLQNSSSLPESKSAAIQTIMDLNKEFPGLLSQDYVADLLDLGTPNSYFEKSLLAFRSAELENEEIIYEGKLVDPQEYEDHIKHWQSHFFRIQSSDFKNTVPLHRQKLMFDHIRAHEMLMDELAKKSQSFMQLLKGIPQYPLFYIVSMDPKAQQVLLPGEGSKMFGNENQQLMQGMSGEFSPEMSSLNPAEPLPTQEPPQVVEPTGQPIE